MQPGEDDERRDAGTGVDHCQDLARHCRVRKLTAEREKLPAEREKLFAEALKLGRERWLAPIIALGGLVVGALGILVAYAGIFLRPRKSRAPAPGHF